MDIRIWEFSYKSHAAEMLDAQPSCVHHRRNISSTPVERAERAEKKGVNFVEDHGKKNKKKGLKKGNPAAGNINSGRPLSSRVLL